MDVIQGVAKLPRQFGPTAVTLGSFDGVHRGHQELISRLLKVSREQKLHATVMTFRPHPSRILTPEKPVLRLFDENDQRERMELLGVETFVEEPFTAELSKVGAEDFFEQWIWQGVQPKVLVIGHDFVLGSGRRGTQDILRGLCDKKKVELMVVPPVQVEGIPVSSSRIRLALSEGRVAEAELCLGRPYYVKGMVIAGEGRARHLGTPTANTRPLVEFTPRYGVYVSQTRVGSQTFSSITNIGVNPTFHQEPHAPVKVETHLFDFSSNLYGREIRVELLHFIRDEKKFSGIEELKKQILLDIQFARSFASGK